MKKNKKLLIGIGIVFLLGIVVVNVNIKKNDNKIRIAALFPLTGNVASVGEHLKNGLELGCKKFVNEVELVVDDSKADAKTGYSAFQRILFQKKPKMIFTAISGVALAIRDVTEKASILHFSMVGSSNLLTPKSKYTYRFFPSTDYLCSEIVGWLRKNDIKRIAVLYLNNEWGNSYRTSIKRAADEIGIRIVYQTSVDYNRDSYSSIAHVLREANVECVCISMQGDEYAEMIKRIRSNGYEGTILCDNNFTSSVAQRCRNNLNNVMLMDFQNPQGDRFDLFIDTYKKQYGKMPDMPAILSYEVMQIVNQVNEKYGEDAWYNADQLQDMRFDGMIGSIHIMGREIRFPLQVKDAMEILR